MEMTMAQSVMSCVRRVAQCTLPACSGLTGIWWLCRAQGPLAALVMGSLGSYNANSSQQMQKM